MRLLDRLAVRAERYRYPVRDRLGGLQVGEQRLEVLIRQLSIEVPRHRRQNLTRRAMRTGKHMGTSRPILPPMPWMYYGQLPDDDLRAMFAYLKSLPPIANRVPVPLDPSGKPIEEPQ